MQMPYHVYTAKIRAMMRRRQSIELEAWRRAQHLAYFVTAPHSSKRLNYKRFMDAVKAPESAEDKGKRTDRIAALREEARRRAARTGHLN